MIMTYTWDNPDLQNIWKQLYTNNPYVFPYSSWEYNEQIYKYMKVKPSTLRQKNYFLVYMEQQKPLVLFPLFLKKNTLHIFGENISGAGHIDALYDPAITTEQWKRAFHELQQMFPGRTLLLRMLNERSKLYSFLQHISDTADTIGKSMTIEKEGACVKIPFPDDYEAYEQGLSRNARSNLHKAYSKIRRNNIETRLQVIHGPFTDTALLSDVIKIYTKRESERKHRRMDFFPYLKHRYFSALAWAMETMDSHYTFCLFLNHQPAAFMTGFATNYNEIVFPYVAIDSAFSTYSPGKVMIGESIKYLQTNTAIRGLDLSRGDERYKLEMGGIRHYNYRFEIQL